MLSVLATCSGQLNISSSTASSSPIVTSLCAPECAEGLRVVVLDLLFHSSSLAFDTNKVCLRQLVRRPADRSRRRGCDNTCLHSSEESIGAFSSPNDACGGPQTSAVPDFCICCIPSCLQQCFDHVKWCCSCCGETTCNTSCSTVCEWVVTRCPSLLEDLRERFVGGELERSEGYGHRESGWVRNVESSYSLGSPDLARAVDE